jgi:hypothetical protein
METGFRSIRPQRNDRRDDADVVGARGEQGRACTGKAEGPDIPSPLIPLSCAAFLCHRAAQHRMQPDARNRGVLSRSARAYRYRGLERPSARG